MALDAFMHLTHIAHAPQRPLLCQRAFLIYLAAAEQNIHASKLQHMSVKLCQVYTILVCMGFNEACQLARGVVKGNISFILSLGQQGWGPASIVFEILNHSMQSLMLLVRETRS